MRKKDRRLRTAGECGDAGKGSVCIAQSAKRIANIVLTGDTDFTFAMLYALSALRAISP
jgi:hypothetical protein